MRLPIDYEALFYSYAVKKVQSVKDRKVIFPYIAIKELEHLDQSKLSMSPIIKKNVKKDIGYFVYEEDELLYEVYFVNGAY